MHPRIMRDLRLNAAKFTSRPLVLPSPGDAHLMNGSIGIALALIGGGLFDCR